MPRYKRPGLNSLRDKANVKLAGKKSKTEMTASVQENKSKRTKG